MRSVLGKILILVALVVGQTAFGQAEDQIALSRLTGHDLIRASGVTLGGKDGEIIRVSNLNEDGAGSLRAALSQKGRRMIVFEVGGVIDLKGRSIVIDEPFVTIAGQTAPSPGITLIKGGLVIRGHDVIVQHIRIRVGDLGEPYRSGRDIDAITTAAAHNVIVDHCSLSWATDENLSASGPRFTGDDRDAWSEGTSHNILFSNNIIAEGLAHSTHAKGEHSKGSLIHDNVRNIIIYRNLYAHNFERSPLFKGGVRGSIVNNFIYNPGQRAVHYNLQGLEWGAVAPVPGFMNLIGNTMRGGPDTPMNTPLLMIGGDGDLNLFSRDNIAVDKWGKPLPQSGRYTTSETRIHREMRPHALPKVYEILNADQVESYVLSHAGARPWDRDQHDVRVLADVAEGRGEIIDSQKQVGGYPKIKPSRRDFDLSEWDIDLMTPKSKDVLDAGSKAKGT